LFGSTASYTTTNGAYPAPQGEKIHIKNGREAVFKRRKPAAFARARDRSGTKNLRVFVFGVWGKAPNSSPREEGGFFVGADSPVFCGAKNAPKKRRRKYLSVYLFVKKRTPD
jgi:hypothetical protein